MSGRAHHRAGGQSPSSARPLRAGPLRAALALCLFAAAQPVQAQGGVPLETAMQLCRAPEGSLTDLQARLLSGGWQQATAADIPELALIQASVDAVMSGRFRAGMTIGQNEAAIRALVDQVVPIFPASRVEAAMSRDGAWVQIQEILAPAASGGSAPADRQFYSCIFAGPPVPGAATAVFGGPLREVPAAGLPFAVHIVQVVSGDARTSIYSFHPQAGALGSIRPPTIIYVPRLR